MKGQSDSHHELKSGLKNSHFNQKDSLPTNYPYSKQKMKLKKYREFTTSSRNHKIKHTLKKYENYDCFAEWKKIRT